MNFWGLLIIWVVANAIVRIVYNVRMYLETKEKLKKEDRYNEYIKK